MLTLAALVAWSGGCRDALFVEAGSGASIVLAYDLSPSSQVVGGIGEAFARADRVLVRVTGGPGQDEELIVAVSPSAGEARVQVDVELEAAEESRGLEVELRLGSQTLFRGQTTLVLRRGESVQVTLSLTPVPAALRMPDALPILRSLNETIELEAAALFATGEEIPGVAPLWSTLDPEIVEVLPDGRVTSRGEGEARLVATLGNLSETVLITVAATVTGVQVLPPTAAIFVTGTQLFTARPHDANGNPLVRTVTWSSGQPTIATVDGGGAAAGVAAGNATITATFNGISGSATLTVRPRLPLATTAPATSVAARSATLHGSVDPLDAPGTAWFEYGTSATLSSFTTSASVSVGLPAGARPISFNATGLNPATTYYFRAVASGESGTTRGNILSFTTTSPPNAPSGLTATAVSPTAIVLNWSDNSGNETEFRIERRTGSGTFATIASVASNIVSHTDGGLLPQTMYTYRVLACSDAGCSNPSNEASATTAGAAPAAPSNVVARGISPTAVRVTWQDNSTNEEEFRIESGAEVGKVGANQTSFVVDNLEMHTIFQFRVRACNSIGCSPYSDVAEGWTQGPPIAITLDYTIVAEPSSSDPDFLGTARIRGEVAPYALPTTAWFEVIREDHYYEMEDEWMVVGEFEVPADAFLTSFSADAVLAGDWCYVYRMVAENDLDIAYGEEEWFCFFGNGSFSIGTHSAPGSGVQGEPLAGPGLTRRVRRRRGSPRGGGQDRNGGPLA